MYNYIYIYLFGKSQRPYTAGVRMNTCIPTLQRCKNRIFATKVTSYYRIFATKVTSYYRIFATKVTSYYRIFATKVTSYYRIFAT